MNSLPFSPTWGQFVIGLILTCGALAVATTAIWKKWLIPFFRGARRLWRALKKLSAVIESLWYHFNPNGGNSLVDRIGRIEERATAAHEAAELASQKADKAIAQNDTAIEQNEAIIDSVKLTRYITARLVRHDLNGDLAAAQIAEIEAKWIEDMPDDEREKYFEMMKKEGIIK